MLGKFALDAPQVYLCRSDFPSVWHDLQLTSRDLVNELLLLLRNALTEFAQTTSSGMYRSRAAANQLNDRLTHTTLTHHTG